MRSPILVLALSSTLATACASTKSGLGTADAAALHRGTGRMYLEQRDYQSATTELLRALREDEHSAETHYLLGVTYRERHLYDDAREALERALDLRSDYVEAMAALGIVEQRTGHNERAEKLHREALKHDPNNADVHNNLGFTLYIEGRFPEAITELRTSIRLGGGKRAHNNLGLTYAKLGDVSRAYREFQQGGTEAEASFNIGWVYERLDDRERAKESYQRALDADPGFARAKESLARLEEPKTKETEQ